MAQLRSAFPYLSCFPAAAFVKLIHLNDLLDDVTFLFLTIQKPKKIYRRTAGRRQTDRKVTYRARLPSLKSGVIGSAGVLIFGDTVLWGAKIGYPLDFFQNFWFNIFLKSSVEKSNTCELRLNTYFRTFSNYLTCGPLGPAPPRWQRVNLGNKDIWSS